MNDAEKDKLLEMYTTECRKMFLYIEKKLGGKIDYKILAKQINTMARKNNPDLDELEIEKEILTMMWDMVEPESELIN